MILRLQFILVNLTRQSVAWSLFLLLCATLTSRTALAQTIRYVTTNGSQPNPAVATSWATATSDLQGAISASQAGDQVWVANGTYKPSTVTDRNISFVMLPGVSIYGGFAGNETALSARTRIDPLIGQPSSTTLSGDLLGNDGAELTNTGDNSYHVIKNGAGLTATAVLDGFVIMAGNGNGSSGNFGGGGVLNASQGAGQVCSPSFRNCLFQANYAVGGGAMYNDGSNGGTSSPLITNCAFLANRAYDGGAIYNDGSNRGISSPVLTTCDFQGNSASRKGGAVFNDGTSSGNSNSKLTNCTFRDSRANVGGALYNDGSYLGTSNPLLTNCTFQNNSSGSVGGAVLNYGMKGTSSPQMTSCVFEGNRAYEAGGAIKNDGTNAGTSSPLLFNCVFRNNTTTTSAGGGGAIKNDGTDGTSNPQVTNCAFLTNSAHFGGAIESEGDGSNPLLANCAFQGNRATVFGGAISCLDGTTILNNCVLFDNGGSQTFSVGHVANITLRYSLVEPAVRDYAAGDGNLITSTSPFVSGTSVALNSCSGAINTGNGPLYFAFQVNNPATDLVGNPRIVGTSIDMGAVEFQTTPNLPLAFTRQPTSGSAVCAGTRVSVPVSVTGTGPFNYQWYRDGSLLTDQTTATLTTSADAASYQVVVTSACSSLTSNAFTVSVLPFSPESQALVDLYSATGGPNWTRKDNWLKGCTPCGWYGVTCTNGRVTALNLISNNLTGTLPASLSALTSLQSLELGANALTGGIPTGIGSLTALQTLNLSRTQLGGGIPASLGQLTRLQNLLLNESQLTGSLPASLGTFAQLQNLQLYTNQLSGCFPTSYTALCGRASISFANNPDLPGGGDFGAFCTNGTGGELVVVQGPRSGTACSGSAFSFSVVARGAGSYQWYKFGSGPGEFQRLAESGPVLSFSAVTAADAGTYQVYINYGCRAGAVQSDLVTLTVPQPGTGGCAQANTAPVATANTSQTATVGRAFSYTVNAFADAQTPTSLTYSASINPANGLSFDATTRVLSGTPSQPEPVSVTITATDPGGLSASTSFSISVGPRVVSSTPLRVTLTASPQTVLTSGSTVLRATATGGTLGAPPNGYTYDFKGPGEFITSGSEQITVSNLPAGVQTFTVVVSDAGTPTRQTTSATVSVTVTDANTAPTVANAIASQSATVGQSFRYVIPAGTFTDAQTPNSLSLSVAGLPQGVTFIAPATLSGTPSLSGVSRVTVTATDPGGLSATTSFSITVQPAPVVVTPLALTLTASPTALLTTGTVSLSATVSGGTPSYRFTFSGPGAIVPSNNTAQVSNLPAGVQTFTVVVSDAATPTNQSIAKTVSVTVSAPATNTALRVLHLDADNSPTNNAIKPNLQLENTGTAPIAYGQLTLRYWLTVEQFSPLTNLSVYYAQLGTAKVTMKYVALDKPRQGAYGYVEYSFDGSAGTLAAGANSGLIQTGIAKQDYTPFNEADDYSYANTRSLTVNTRITAYLNGQLAWGVEPAEIASQRTVKAYTENKNGSSTNTISTFLQVRNEGNVAVNYSDLKVRYYFTSEGSQPLNVYLNYAVLGNQKIKGQFVRPNPPLANADAYLELSFDASLGMFNPGSSTGNIQYRIAKQDWSNFTQSNDYSYQNGTQSMTENSRVVVYLAGQRIYGSEPGAGARSGIAETDTPLRVTVLGNPVTGAEVSFDVTGVEGQSVQMQLIDESGRPVSERLVEQAEALERQTLPVGKQNAGLLLLRVSTPGQSQTVKVLKTN